MKYTIVLRQAKEGYSVSCPAVPGCSSPGATKEETINNIRDAIQ